ncbi:MAG: RNA 2',3'-cyclic phosphodiesterase [Armatimonadetes bacterium]|nr:RNA 2',3'-cyclic phosphodiesterase [Armatimonadota bacterium]
MRLFTCLSLSPDVRESVSAVQARLQSSGANLRWTPSEQFHLTVTFVGELPDPSLLPEVEAVCAQIAAETVPFRFRVAGVSTFPKRGETIKTVILNITEGAESWKQLVLRSEPWLAPFGAKREGGLAAHITLGRVKGGDNLPDLRDAIAREAVTDCGEQTADELVLIESALSPTGATYIKRSAWQFTGE